MILKDIKLPFKFLFASIMGDTDDCLNKTTECQQGYCAQ